MLNNVNLAEKLGIDLRGNMQGAVNTTCPQCSHTRKKSTLPCLKVDLNEGWYKCAHCEWKGSLEGANKAHAYIPQPSKPKKQGEYRPDTLRALKANEIAFFEKRGISEKVDPAEYPAPRGNHHLICFGVSPAGNHGISKNL